MMNLAYSVSRTMLALLIAALVLTGISIDRASPLAEILAATKVGDFRYTVLTPTSLGSGNVDNYSPTGLATATVLRITSSGNISLRGIDSSGSGDGRVLYIYNANASSAVSIITNSGGSLADNQITVFSGAASVTLPTGSTATLIYSTATSKWLLVSIGSTRYPALTVDGTSTLTGAVTMSSTMSSGRRTVTGSGPVVTSCGTGPGTLVGNDSKFRVVVGASATGCVFTFATTWGANAPICIMRSEANIDFTYTVSSTAVTVTGVGDLSSTALVGDCDGR